MTLNQAVKNAVRRFVTTEAGSSEGSGVIITTGIVMSCFHSLHVDNGIKVNDVEAEIIAVDPVSDLVLLSLETEEIETIRLGDIGIGQNVLTIGNPMGLSGALLFGRVIWINEKQIIHDMHGSPGISGSALFNYEGEMIGLNHSVLGAKNIGSHYTVAVPSEKMKKILSKIFNIVQPTTEEVQKYGNGGQDENLD